ncbi:MAG: hypothetical protein JST49_06065 [Bacteroidetes bacterium]|nr:hypothetical protein [Bacteroidota bacterium]
MKRMFTKMLLPVAMLAVLSGCKKDEDNTPQQPSAVSPTQTFNYSDAWGLLAGVKTVTSQSTPIGPIDIELGTAVAAFNVSAGSSEYQDAGTVSCNTKGLTKQTGNSYVFQPSQADVTGIEFNNGSSWNVSGSTNVPAFTASFNQFPSTPTLNSTNDVTLADGYTVSFTSVSGADSVLVILATNNSYAEKRLAGWQNSATFTASDLNGLSASQYGMIQVTPYTWDVRTNLIPGKKVYMVNQVTVTKIVEFK